MKTPKFNYTPVEYSLPQDVYKPIHQCANEAINMARERNQLVQFFFDGILINVTPYMTVDQVYNNYAKRVNYLIYMYVNSERGMRDNTAIKLENIKQERKNKLFFARISDEKFETESELFCKHLKSDHANDFQLNNHPVDFAMNWAKLMQVELKSGKKFTKNLVEQTMTAANIYWFPDETYDYAKIVLVSCWAYGVALGKLLGMPRHKIALYRRMAQWKHAQMLRHKRRMEMFGNVRS